jgi:hypothetical protein
LTLCLTQREQGKAGWYQWHQNLVIALVHTITCVCPVQRCCVQPINTAHSPAKGPGTHLWVVAANTRFWRSPSQNSRPLLVGVFQSWEPTASSGEEVRHPDSAALPEGSSGLQGRQKQRRQAHVSFNTKHAGLGANSTLSAPPTPTHRMPH